MTTGEIISVCAVVMSTLTAIVSLLNLRTTWHLWRLVNRPMVIVAVETKKSGNAATALELVVTNVGNRPAVDVRLRVKEAALHDLLTGTADDPCRLAVCRCFSAESTLPVLIPASVRRNAFGVLAVGQAVSTWRSVATLPVSVSYRDLETGRGFRYVMNIRIADNAAFAGSEWQPSNHAPQGL